MKMMKKCFFSILLFALIVSCSAAEQPENQALIELPSDVTVMRVSENTVSVTWRDNSDNESGFKVYYCRAGGASFTYVQKVGANVTSCNLKDLFKDGMAYYVGVSAFDKSGESEIVKSPIFRMQNLSILPSISGQSILNKYSNCACVKYKLSNISGYNDIEYGLCWSSDGNPVYTNDHIHGPAADANGEVFQVIPNVVFAPNVKYKVRVYLKHGDELSYGEPFEITMQNGLSGINLEWNKLAQTGLPDDVEVYCTESPLNGKRFRAWYAVAKPGENIELKVNVPFDATTIDDQAAKFNGACLVLVNGGYFYNGQNTGVTVVNTLPSGGIYPVRGSLKTSEQVEYNTMYNITRGIFGVDADNKPDIKWVGLDAGGVTKYYDVPLPSVKGESKYPAVSTTIPCKPASWSPKYALSAGPVLLKNGVIPFNFDNTDKGADYYVSNFEIMPYDIFGPEVSPDRTAIGYREDGSVILLVCDGRIERSGGATLLELAQIMKGLGCVSALNLDGGGSSGIWVNGTHLNDMTGGNRPVASTVGFFRK